MNIGAASAKSGLPPKTIRYYEDIDLLVPDRSENGYRRYNMDDINCLRFIGHARQLGFSIEECKTLLSLYRDTNRSSGEVKEMALRKIQAIEKKISQLQSMRDMLGNLAANCHGDERPDCPILEGIAELPYSD